MKLDMQKSKFLADNSPVDKYCNCYVCKTYTRSYICHLLKAKEITPLKLLTFHNLHLFNIYVQELREEIEKGKI